MASKQDIQVAKKGMNRDAHDSEVSNTEYTLALNANFQDEHGGSTLLLQNESSNILCSKFKPGFDVVGYKYDINSERVYFFLANKASNVSEIGYINAYYTHDPLEEVENGCNCNLSAILETPLETIEQSETCTYNTIISDECQPGLLNFSTHHPIYNINIQIKNERIGKTIYWTDGFNPPRYIKLDVEGIVADQIYTDTIDCDGLHSRTLTLQGTSGSISITIGDSEYTLDFNSDLPTTASDFVDTHASYILATYGIVVTSNISSITFTLNSRLPKISSVNLSGDLNATIYKCIDTEAMRIFKRFSKPCIVVEDIVSGGNLKAGMYEVVIAYANKSGDVMSNWMSITNPIALHDQNQYILTQPQLDYNTGKSIAIDLQDLDQRFEYFRILVIYHSGLDQAVNYVNYGTFPIGRSKLTISDISNKPLTTYEETIQLVKPTILTSNGLTNTNGYLFQYDYTEQRELNLQPVVNLMGAFAKWVTYQAKEDLYLQGDNVSNYRTYMRDEVYPHGIKFFSDGGFETAVLPFIPRPPKESEIADYNITTNFDSVTQYNPECSSSNRFKKWQFENTATVDDTPCSIDTSLPHHTEDRTMTETCVVSETDGTPTVVDTLASGTTSFVSDLDFISYINSLIDTNFFDTCVDCDATMLEIASIVTNPSQYDPANVCTPSFDESICDSPSLVSSGDKMFVLGVDSLSLSPTDSEIAEYTRAKAPDSCNTVQIDMTSGNPVLDSDNYSYYGGKTLYKRFNVSNTTTDKAKQLTKLTTPQVDNPKFLPNKYSTEITDLYDTSINVTAYPSDYQPYLHSNAAWFKADFSTKDQIIIELSPILCDYTDSNSGSSLRLSFFGANDLNNEVSTYSTLITNLSLENDPDKFIILNKSDFTSTSIVYIAVDSPLVETGYSTTRFGLSLGSGTSTITINVSGTDHTYDFTQDSGGLKKTVANILETYRQQIWDDTSVYMEGRNEDLIFSYNSSTTTISIDTNNTEYPTKTNYALQPPCGCFNLYYRDVLKKFLTTFSGLNFGRRQEYTTTCHYDVIDLGNCKALPLNKGLFSYWESEELYPCNNELYNSSSIKVNSSEIPLSIKSEFEEYFTNTGQIDTDGNYLLTDETNYVNKPIRHYKYPDNRIAPFINTSNNAPADFKESTIYPLAFTISPEVINYFLDVAVNNGLITSEERSTINKYEIYRGDRRVAKSVIAKGIMFDMLAEKDLTKGAYYSNYPLNSLGNDSYNGSTGILTGRNSRFTFQSPETRFAKPTLGRELYVDGYMFGKSRSVFDVVENHPTYTLLAQGAYTLATTLAIAESSLELIVQTYDWTVLGGTGGYSSFISIASAIAAGISYTAAQVFKTGQYRLQWINTLYDLGQPKNHAYYSATVGYYNNLLPTEQGSAHLLRGLSISQYLKEGMWEMTDEYDKDIVRINNQDREESVFLKIGNDEDIQYPLQYANYDNTSVNPGLASRRGYAGVGRSESLLGNTAVPYVAIKQYMPTQYGTINSVAWLSTGFCGDLSSTTDCEGVFGGDIYISRFAVKRKFPYFTTNAYGLAPLTPFTYSHYLNINPTDRQSLEDMSPKRFYINYKTVDEQNYEVGIGSALFPSMKSQYKLDYLGASLGLYVNDEAKFYLFSYGFPHFLVESTYNCNYRYAGVEKEQQFYPRVGDVIKYTQEKNVSISEYERFNYNPVYSTTISTTPFRTIPVNYSKEVYDKLSFSKNGVIVSKKDNSENSLTDPWLVYNALDTHQFPTSFGALKSITEIESDNMLCRFTNGVSVFGAEDQVVLRMAQQGNNFNKTDLGHAGTQHKAIVSTEFGHFWADAKRGKVFCLKPGGQGLDEVSKGLEKWLKEQLPFKILQSIPNAPIDNTFEGIGLTLGYDARLKRVFLTKKDYRFRRDVPVVMKYSDDLGFYYDAEDPVQVSLTDTDFFEDCSWTVGYSPLTDTWISYYSFKPDYYISYPNYFQTGISFSKDSNEIGLWSHLPFLSSYQVFYGKLYPFSVEYVIPTKYTNSVLETVEFMLDVRKFYNQFDSADVYGVGFNKAYIYNTQQSSGQIILHHQKNNDMRQQVLYPKYNTNSTEILQTEINGLWSFNAFYNIVRNEKSILPVFKWDPSNIEKTFNNDLLDYTSRWKDRLRGDYFKVNLTQDAESRFKFILRFQLDSRMFYGQ
jgi:hypothetical protein